MRFIYGFIMGVLSTTIASILYLAFGGGEYLVQLSPHYHELNSEVAALRDAKQQRDQLASRLDALAKSFDELTRRFADLQRNAHDPAAAEPPTPEPVMPPVPSPTSGAAPSATPAA